MGNLGLYQIMVEFAKKVGGPRVLGLITMILGYATIRPIEGAIKKLIKGLKKSIDNTEYEVSKKLKLQDGLELDVGDKFKVLAEIDKSILIEVINNTKNPFIVDKKTLVNVSNYS